MRFKVQGDKELHFSITEIEKISAKDLHLCHSMGKEGKVKVIFVLPTHHHPTSSFRWG